MAVELANAYVTLSVETSSISKSVGRMFSGVESQAGKTGRNMGRSMATSFEKAKPNVEVLEADVKRAQDRVVAHKESGSRKMEAANRKVEIAQAKVNEVTKKYGPDSSQALRAQDQLITAQQKAEAEAMNYRDSLGRLEGKLKDSQTALADAARAAEDSGSMWDRMGDKLASAGDKMHNVGDRFKAAGQSIGDVGSDLTRKITVPIGGAIAAAGGLTAALGFKRLVGIDTAKAQIQGLGYDADKVMQDVDKGLMNTSMSMADGAAVARSALATGNVEIGQDLEDQINRVANVSAAYGIESSHAGYLLNNVLTKNKVTWGDLSQMQENQIPVVSQLADHYGVTGDEIEKMAQEGKISIEDLNTVLDDNAGKAAEEYAKSWQGITDNIGAYISRLGADALGGLFETMKVEASGLVDVLSSEKASEFARALGEHLAVALQKVIGFVRGLVGWFVNLSPIWQKLIVGAIGFAVALGPILIVVGKIVAVVGSFIGVAGTMVSVVGGLVAGFRGVALAAGASRAALIAQSVATKLAAAAQWLLNNAMKASVIGLIVVAIGALVAAFIHLWKTNEGFRDFFVGLWEGISSFFVGMWENYLKPVFQAIGDFWSNTLVPAFQTAWESGIKPVFEGIGTVVMWLWGNIIQPYIGFVIGLWMSLGEVFMWVWENVLSHVFTWFGDIAVWLWEKVLSPVFTWIGDHWHYILLGMQLFWETVLKPVFNAIAFVATWLWEEVLSPVFSWIGQHWSSVMDIMSWAWTYILQPVFNAIAVVARWLWENVLSPVFSFIGRHWDKVLTAMKWAWTYILRPVWDAIVAVATWLWETILEPIFSWIGDHWEAILFAMKYIWENHLKPAWERMKSVATWLWEKLSDIFTWIGNKWSWMKDKIVGVYNKYIKPVFDRFGTIVTNLKDKFKTGVDNIKKQWDKLKSIAAKPVKFVIEDIFNDGLINTLNKIPGVNISDIPVPKWASQYADGGWTGPGSRLTPAGLVHADEYVVRKASRGRFERENPGMLDHINKHGTMAGYAKGGLVRPVGGPLTSRFGAGRGRYPHAGVDWAVPIGTPVKAALAGTALGRQPAGRTGRYVFLSHPGGRNTYYGHLSRPMVSAGDSVAKGQVIGLSGNTGRSTGPHLHFETWTGGKPVNPLQYMGGLPESSGGDEGGGWFDPLAPFRALGDKIKSSITDKFPGSGFMIDAAAGIAKQGFDNLLDWAKSIIPGLGDPDDGSGVAGGGGGSMAVRGQVQSVADQFGWGSGAQWSALSNIIQKESSWNPAAANPSSSARGLFQMIAANRSAPYTDVAGHSREGLNYIKNRYGTPTKALAFHNRNNWYDKGGLVGSITRDNGGVVPPGSSVINNWTRDPEWMYTNKQQDTVQAALEVLRHGGAGTTINVAGDLSTKDVDEMADILEKKARRRRAVGTVSTL